MLYIAGLSLQPSLLPSSTYTLTTRKGKGLKLLRKLDKDHIHKKSGDIVGEGEDILFGLDLFQIDCHPSQFHRDEHFGLGLTNRNNFTQIIQTANTKNKQELLCL